MKTKLLCLFTMLCLACGVMAQEVSPYLVKEGKEWAFRSLVAQETRDVVYKLSGDTIINGHTYTKEWQQAGWIDSSRLELTQGFLREENGKVYRKEYDKEEYLWFDYNANIGDTIFYEHSFVKVVGHSDTTIICNGVSRTYKGVDVQVGVYDVNIGTPDSSNHYKYYLFPGHIETFYEELGLFANGDIVSSPSFYSTGKIGYLLYVKQGDTMLYQREEEKSDPSRPTTKYGYGIYYGDTYLYRYTINESEAVTDSTDFARWNDKTVIYFDVDTIGPNAFSGATFRQGQVLYFTERLNCIMPDAFTDIMMLDDEQAEENPFGDLCIVFNGNAPSIDKSSISNYADTTYRITYVVPDLAAYIEDDIQWTYSQLVTIEDFVKGYISPENEVTVNSSTEVEAETDMDNNTNGNVNVVVHARPRKDIPVRIGEGENKDIYSRAPAWMRYTMELRIIDTEGTELYSGEMQCSAYGECLFNVSLACPSSNIIHIYSRSIDMFGRATAWSKERINLKGYEYEGDYVTDANVDLNNTADADGLTATIGTDSIRITGYYSSNCGGGLYCVAIARGNDIELIFHDGAAANCFDYHHVDFMIPRFSDEIKRIDVIEPYPLEVTINDVSSVTDIDNPEADAPYYDLLGRPVANPTRGIYIRNGHKVVL